MRRTRHPDHMMHSSHRRAGFTTPAVAVALLVIMMGLALILDRIWLETAKLELTSAAEAAALAAAGDLASDDSLLANTAVDLRLNNARQSAEWIASQNYVCGTPVTLNTDPEGDIRFGNLVAEATGIRFEESTANPNTVVVTALRTRSNNNPVALFVSGASGLPFGDVAARVEATVNNDVIGLRPLKGSPVPALPIAILQLDPTGERSDTWKDQIDLQRGVDEYSFDSESHTISEFGDGIKEITLRGLYLGGDPTDANVLMVDLGTGLNDVDVARQFKKGLMADDLDSINGEILLGQGATLDLTASPQLDGTHTSCFESLVGKCRICFLYTVTTPLRQQPMVTATCTELVAIRVMAVREHNDGSCDVTVQPTVMTSRNAILASENNDPSSNSSSDDLTAGITNALNNSAANALTNHCSTSASGAIPNPYIYKLRLTH
ncbi:pilus assembly protein TadG-related protein [Schlesneria paludicola]|uniref:pilus assembly protein TadG-related protein n=1 Tax=Schlesneria paludicola TaxID=360056 RepID=UPI00029AAD62|nr:pilus assembly protein TadG-related protein [Schlesneria paludicola]